MKSTTCLFFSFALVFFSSAHGAGNDPDLVMARELFTQKKYRGALEIVAPCLKAKTPNVYSNLEDCLFLGEEITEAAVRPIAEQYEKETNFGRSGVQFTDWQGAVPYIRKGLNIRLGHYGGVIYAHEFLKHLRALFPASKYRHEYSYRLISRGENNIESVNQWIKELDEYCREFPTGRYFIHATVDLAHAYDNLWDILKPESKVGYYEAFSSGDRAHDSEQSEAYRKKALVLYETILKRGITKDPEMQRIVDGVKERYPNLVERKGWNAFYILND